MLTHLVLLCGVSTEMCILCHNVTEVTQILWLSENHACVLWNAHYYTVAHRHAHRHLNVLAVTLTHALRLRVLPRATCLHDVTLGCLTLNLGSERLLLFLLFNHFTLRLDHLLLLTLLESALLVVLLLHEVFNAL